MFMFFPVIGLFVGIILSMIYTIYTYKRSDQVTNIHIDGLWVICEIITIICIAISMVIGAIYVW